ncbi:MAG: Holliday junction resolvase RuvX [Candidatus Omnitrophota bacterium]
MNHQRIMSLDVGEKRIGVAMTDETKTISSALDVIERKNIKKDLENIKDFITRYNVGKIVVGMPLTLKGRNSIQTDIVCKFVEELRKHIKINIVTFDERLSTAQSERILIAADISRKKRKSIIDKLAAQIILQDYLESERNA